MPICFSIGNVTLNSFVKCVALKLEDKDQLRLNLPSKLIILVSTNSIESQNRDCDTYLFDLVEQEYKRVGEYKVLLKTLNTLSVAEYYSWQASTISNNSVQEFLKINMSTQRLN